MNIPNILTMIRFILVPVFILIFFSSGSNYLIESFYIFLLAGLTDVLDGYIARKYDLITKFGTVMDPLADKVMLLCVLCCYMIKGLIPLWIVMIIFISELLMIFGALYLYFFNEEHVVPSNKFGKVATVFFYLAIVLLVFFTNEAGVINIIVIAVLIKVIAFTNYSFGFGRLLWKKRNAGG